MLSRDQLLRCDMIGRPEQSRVLLSHFRRFVKGFCVGQLPPPVGWANRFAAKGTGG